MARLVALVAAAAILLAWWAPARAQETPVPEAGPETARFFPAAAAFGDGWSEERTVGLQVPSDIFREGAISVYGGPAGARVALLVYLTTESRVAIRQSWEQATETFDQYRYSLAEDYDYDQRERLEAMEPPEGCVEAKRAEGTDARFGYTAGITMCAVEPDVILLVAASGGIGSEVGFAASDNVVAAALAAAGA